MVQGDRRQPAALVVLGALGKAALIMLVHPVWSGMAQLNVAHSPRIPWAPPTMMLLLLVLWGFLDGRLGPRRSRASRSALLRWRLPRAGTGGWSVVATAASMGAMFFVDTHSYLVTESFGGLPTEGMANLPPATGVSFAIVASALAALVEESAFRGYMQSDLATRFRFPATAAMVAVSFAAFHLYGRTIDQWTAGLVPWLTISVLFSGLVWLTDSLIPAVIGHFVLDLSLFSLDWLDDPLRALRRPLLGMQVSAGAACFCVLALISAVAFWRLGRIASTSPVASSTVPR
jgi:membrane protease YdiL (CAAX protease family)